MDFLLNLHQLELLFFLLKHIQLIVWVVLFLLLFLESQYIPIYLFDFRHDLRLLLLRCWLRLLCFPKSL